MAAPSALRRRPGVPAPCAGGEPPGLRRAGRGRPASPGNMAATPPGARRAAAADSVEAIVAELAAAATPERAGRAQDSPCRSCARWGICERGEDGGREQGAGNGSAAASGEVPRRGPGPRGRERLVVRASALPWGTSRRAGRHYEPQPAVLDRVLSCAWWLVPCSAEPFLERDRRWRPARNEGTEGDAMDGDGAGRVRWAQSYSVTYGREPKRW
jgi:hypothetical protein